MPRQSTLVGDLLGAKAFKAAIESTDANFQELYNAPNVEYVDTVADFPLAIAGRLIQTKGLNTVGDGGGRLYQNDPANTDTVDGVTVVESQAVLPGITTDDIEVPNSWATGGLPYDVLPVTITDNDSQSRDVVEFERPIGTTTAIAYTYYVKADESEVGYAFSVEVWIAPTGDNRVSLSLYSGSSHRVTSAEILSGSATVSISSGIANVVGVAAGFHKLKIATTYTDVDRILVYPFDASSGESGPLRNHLYGWAFSFGKWVELSTQEQTIPPAPLLIDTTSDLGIGTDEQVKQTKGLATVGDGSGNTYIYDPTSTRTIDGYLSIGGTGLDGANTADINIDTSWSDNGTTIAVDAISVTDHLGGTVNALNMQRLTDSASGTSYYFKEDQSAVGAYSTSLEFWTAPDGNADRLHVSLRNSSAHSVTKVEVLSGTATIAIVAGDIAEIVGINSGFHKFRVTTTDPTVNRIIMYPYDSSSGETNPTERNNVIYNLQVTHGRWLAAALAGSRGVTADTDATMTDSFIRCDCTSNPITVNLGYPVENRKPIQIKRMDASANALTIESDDGATTYNIDGAATQILTTQYDSLTLLPGDGAWWIV
jgi:hypothetical protein